MHLGTDLLTFKGEGVGAMVLSLDPNIFSHEAKKNIFIFDMKNQ